MKVITVINQKGGVGKTTISINLAVAFARTGARVMLIDADPQSSAMDWSNMRSDTPLMSVIGVPKPQLHRDIKTIGKDYDYVIIDGPPRSTDLARSAVAAADLVVIPVTPSPLDVWATKDMTSIIDELRVMREGLRTAFVINRRQANTAIGRDVREALAGQDFPSFTTAITQRVVFAESLANGSTVFDVDPTGPAALEIEALRAEVLRALQ